jgi:hypothetical protein
VDLNAQVFQLFYQEAFTAAARPQFGFIEWRSLPHYRKLVGGPPLFWILTIARTGTA